MTTIILLSILYIIIGLWICFKRDWYKHYIDQGGVCTAAVIFMPINLLIVFFKEFLINKWNSIYILIFGLFIFSSCDNKSHPLPNENYQVIKEKFPYGNADQIRLVEMDSCEYFVAHAFSNHDITMTHRGRCKYCIIRNNK